MRHKRDVKETFKIGLTIKEKPRKRQKTTQNSVLQIETIIKQRKISRKTQKKTAPRNSTTISKQSSAHKG